MAVAPSPDQGGPKQVRMLVGVDALIITSSVIAVIMTLSTLFPGSGHHFIKGITVVLSKLYVPLITYTIDATSYIDFPSPLLIVSAIILVLLYQKTIPKKAKFTIRVDSNGGASDGDGDDYIDNLTDLGWLAFLLISNRTIIPYKIAITTGVMIILSLIRKLQNWVALKMATQSYELRRNPKLVASYMRQLHGEEDQLEVAELKHSSQYKYLVMGEDKQKMTPSAHGYNITTTNENDLITIDKIRTCQGKLIFNNERNQDVCLSFALFKLLNSRLEGYLPATFLKLVPHGPFDNQERAFFIVDAELDFLKHYLNSPMPYTYYGLWPILNISLCLLLCSCCIYIIYEVIHRISKGDIELTEAYESQSKTYYHALFYLDALACLLILVVTVCLECCEIVCYMLSNQLKVFLLCKYVKHHQDPWIGRALVLFLYVKKGLKGPYWSNQLCQYSFPNTRKEKPIRPVPEQVKEAIIRSLRDSGGELANGLASLSRDEMNIPEALEACRLESVTERILVWHIATAHCDDNRKPAGFVSNDHTVALSLSRYCAYLVSSIPEILPDDTAWTKLVAKQVVHEFKPDGNIFTRCFGLQPVTQKNLVEMGKDLGRQLMTEDGVKRWKVLAGLWAEMIMCAAHEGIGNDEIWEVHAERLTKGGELITHVWALLSHASVNNHLMFGGDRQE